MEKMQAKVMADFLDTLQNELPVSLQAIDLRNRRIGLVVVDEVNGFAKVGAGPLAPASPNPQITRMIERTAELAHYFISQKNPVLAFLDTHTPGKPEPPYPPHCEIGTGQENLVEELAWMENLPEVTLMTKDCINGFIGGIDLSTGRNTVCEWINDQRLEAVLVCGICTDICVMDFVLTLLSARNHGLVPTLRDVIVAEKACATYDLPASVAKTLGLPPTAIHPQKETHHMALYVMASRGAILANEVTL